MYLTTENTIALIIDIQAKLLPFIDGSESLVGSNVRLIKGIASLDIPIIVTEQYPKGLGATDEAIQAALGENYKPIEKDTFSCWGCQEFVEKIKSYGRKNVIISGIETHICVMQTVRDLSANGFCPIVACDCVSSRKAFDKKYGIKRMMQENAIVGTYESILMELTLGSKNPKFKEISNIIK